MITADTGGEGLSVWTAVIAAIPALLIAIVNSWQTRVNTRKLERIKADLQDSARERDARRDYEYDARKRLYSDIEPLIFQLTEASEVALRRISALAVNARQGALSPESEWLTSMTEYYATFTMYSLLVPAAIVRLIKEKLTFVDFGVDEKIRLQFHIANQIYGLWRSDHDLQRYDPPLEYLPHETHARDLRQEHPEIYWKQGLASGHLEIVTSAFINREGDQPPRIIFYEEFARRFKERIPNEFEPLADVFELFHPARRPLLWRILACQAILYRALTDLRDCENPKTFKVRRFKDDEITESFQWEEVGDPSRSPVLQTFHTATAYLRKKLAPGVVDDASGGVKEHPVARSSSVESSGRSAPMNVFIAGVSHLLNWRP